MPCWVAPVVAAELWGVSLEHVLGAIADGSIPSRREYGFDVVDVAPDGAVPSPRRRDGKPPQTYVVITEGDADGPEVPVAVPWEDDVPAPTSNSVAGHMFPEELPPAIPAIVPEVEDPELPPLDEEEDDKPIGNWRQVRSSVGRIRKPPQRTPPPAAFAA